MNETTTMAPIAVLHVMNGFQDSSISRIVQRLILHLDHGDFEWHIGALSSTGDMQQEFQSLGAHVVDFSKGPHENLNSRQRVREYVADHHIRIIHTHTPRTILTAARALAGIPNVSHITTKHLLHTSRDRRWGLIYVLLDRFSLYLPNHIVTVSQLMYRQIVSQPGVRSSRVTMIRNCVPYDCFYVPTERDVCRSELGLTEGSLVIGYTGRIQSVKRIDLLIQAFSEVLKSHPQARLLIVGEGELKTELEDLAHSVGVSQAVIWTGFRKDIPRLLAAIDIYVQPSVNEGLSLSILEAMAAQKPVIATDIGGARELIANEETGILVPINSSLAIEKAIVELLDSPERRLRLSHAAMEHIVKNFSIASMTEAYRRVYETFREEEHV